NPAAALPAAWSGGGGRPPAGAIAVPMGLSPPRPAPAPDIMGRGLPNPTAMILSAALMLDWLGDRHAHAGALGGARTIERAVDRAFAEGLKPCEFGGRDGTAAIGAAVLRALDAPAGT